MAFPSLDIVANVYSADSFETPAPQRIQIKTGRAVLPPGATMAANYWESTQRRHWQFSKDELAQMREKLEESEQSLVQMFPLPQLRHLSIYFNQREGYYERLDTQNASLADNCRSISSASIAKSRSAERTPTLSLRPHYIWRSDFSLSQDESNLALAIVNDHYMTDLPLLYPPHVIALTAILLALVLRPNSPGGQAANMAAAATAAIAQAQASTRASGNSSQNNPGASDREKQQEGRVSKVQRYAAFLTESVVDIEGMVDCTQELISFYECHEQYNDKITREQINRFVKARGLDKA
ncbi:hypothetical protein O1611_g5079 [Lasiodiplodia mahajangana]|uniref:Uncharacterized protein n=1 Tax=Lasiodiplodia mahajangana TaxID=1108764 RepID=A0ACC2JM22_9PEZI|nr:hypothetical protein O1611_g5079 [Lasiodiplodia mahajangana]